jgi:hypothetical protein
MTLVKLRKIFHLIGKLLPQKVVIHFHLLFKTKEKVGPFLIMPFLSSKYMIHFLNFLLNPRRPINPEPMSSMVPGSGLGRAPQFASV